MPHRCAVYGCRGNYTGEPYCDVVKFPSKDNVEAKKIRDTWISAMPNDPKTLIKRKTIYTCKKHFVPNCKWITVQGGKRPDEPPSIFSGIPKSCLKQVKAKERATRLSSSHTRSAKQKERELEKDKIKNFTNFMENIAANVDKRFHVIKNGNDELTLSMTNDLGSQVILFIHFKKVDSPIGFLQLFKAEKHGMDVPKHKFDLQKNSLLHKWTQVRNIITVMNLHEASTQDLLSKLM